MANSFIRLKWFWEFLLHAFHLVSNMILFITIVLYSSYYCCWITVVPLSSRGSYVTEKWTTHDSVRVHTQNKYGENYTIHIASESEIVYVRKTRIQLQQCALLKIYTEVCSQVSSPWQAYGMQYYRLWKRAHLHYIGVMHVFSTACKIIFHSVDSLNCYFTS